MSRTNADGTAVQPRRGRYDDPMIEFVAAQMGQSQFLPEPGPVPAALRRRYLRGRARCVRGRARCTTPWSNSRVAAATARACSARL